MFRVGKDGYVAQCAPPPVIVQGNLAVDFTLVSRANLTASAQSALGFRSVSGTVVEITATGREPVSGVFVDYSAYEDFEPAATYTDRFSRFVLCGLPADDHVALGAFMSGLNGSNKRSAGPDHRRRDRPATPLENVDDRMFHITVRVRIVLMIVVCFALLASGCGAVDRRSRARRLRPRSNRCRMPSRIPSPALSLMKSGRPIAGAGVDACCLGGFPITYSRLNAGNALRMRAVTIG